MIATRYKTRVADTMSDVPNPVKEKTAEMFTHFISVCIDGLFLCLWAAMNFGVNITLNQFHLESADAVIRYVLQWLFGAATLMPIGIFIYRDICVIWIRAKQKIEKSVKVETS